MATPMLEVSALFKSFGSIVALRDVSLEVSAGEAVGLIGENGAGKSTLIKVISGAEQPDSGELALGGESMTFRDPHAAQRAGIATVHQRNWLVGTMSVLQNIELGREAVVGPAGWLRRAAHPDSLDALRIVGLEDRARSPVDTLSLADRQLVAVARALAGGGRLMILDEPTAALSPAETASLFEVIRRVREADMAMLYVSHRLEEFPHTVDRIVVMRDGEIVAAAEPDTPESRLVELMSGREVLEHEQEVVESRHRRLPSINAGHSEALLSVEGLGDRDGAFRGIDFELSHGEVLALIGLPDSGAAELAETIAGARRHTAGRIVLEGRPTAFRTPRQAISRGIGFLAGDRASKGVIPNSSVRSSVTLSALGRVSRFGLVERRRERSLSREMLEMCQVRSAGGEAPIATLSGGNQQKALLARVLTAEPRVLVVQDPTAGVDVGGREGFYELVSDFCRAGAGVVWMSTDLREVTTISDRALVLWRGQIVAELEREQLGAPALMAAQFNVAEDEVHIAMQGASPGEER